MVSRQAWDTGKAVVMDAGILKTDVKYDEIFDDELRRKPEGLALDRHWCRFLGTATAAGAALTLPRRIGAAAKQELLVTEPVHSTGYPADVYRHGEGLFRRG